MKEKLKVFSNGLLKENPSLRLVLGTCPTLAVTTLAVNGLGMGLAATFVLVCSNIAISALRKIIPDKVRLPAYITVIATFVTVLQMLVKAFVPALDSALGIFLPLIVVNCIILGRAEMFASKNSIGLSALDGLGMGLGFTGTLVVMGSVREVLGAGTLFGIQVMPAAVDPMTVFITPPGGFFVFGCLMALVIWIEIKTNNRKVRSIGCEGCPSASVCGGKCADKAMIFFSMILVNNYVLVQFLGICPFLGVSKKLDSAVGMSAAVIFVMALATSVTWPIYTYLLEPNGMAYLQTIVFILIIAVLVQLVEIILKKFMPPLYKALGVYLPLITTNCAVLGVTISVLDEGYNFAESLVCAVGAGVGFMVAMVLFSGVRKRLEDAQPPKCFEGLPITLVAASVTSLSFMGFGGVIENIFAGH